eukprot:TRINITY_DN9395_c0_g1_i1.p1 TRINITY_DN9395_c0_g1~~TRINITY_DN9395_c0_g1_i1.p1  ORF type:complete len:348 (+),score=88.18 TRINITY_DN9395_c0_g1_i1:86-1129(+)
MDCPTVIAAYLDGQHALTLPEGATSLAPVKFAEAVVAALREELGLERPTTAYQVSYEGADLKEAAGGGVSVAELGLRGVDDAVEVRVDPKALAAELCAAMGVTHDNAIEFLRTAVREKDHKIAAAVGTCRDFFGKVAVVMNEIVEQGNVDNVAFLLEAGVSPDPAYGFAYEISPYLPHAIAFGSKAHLAIARLLIRAGANVNAAILPTRFHALDYHTRASVTSSGGSCLVIAVAYKHWDLMKLLVESGADPNRPSFKGETPLSIAVDDGEWDAVRWLVSSGARVDVTGHYGSAVETVADAAPLDVLEQFVAAGAIVTTKGSTSCRARACARRRDDVVAYIDALPARV